MNLNKLPLGLCLYLFLVLNLFADINDSYLFDLSKMPRKDFIKVHKQYIEFVVKKEKSTKYPHFIESKYSWIPDLLQVFPGLISACHAAFPEPCLFGGWVSKKNKRGSCTAPWKARNYAKIKEVDGYGPKCGASNLFRCNPTLFGPGPTEEQMARLRLIRASGVGTNHNVEGGICVDTGGNYNGLTKKCAEMSKELDDLRRKSWLEEMSDTDFTEYYNSKFEPLKKFVDSFCSSTSRSYRDNVCDKLSSRVKKIIERYKLKKVVNVTIDTLSIIPEFASGESNLCTADTEAVLPRKIPAQAAQLTKIEKRPLPKVDKEKFEDLMSDRDDCIKGSAKESENAKSLYEAVARMMSDPKCHDNISSVKRPRLGWDSFSLCKIKLDKKMNNIGSGKLYLNLVDKKRVKIDWNIINNDRGHSSMTVKDWLYGKDSHKGFYDQGELEKACEEKRHRPPAWGAPSF